MKAMRMTIKDIAKKAGVSTTTVSRILNNRDSGIPIRPETRDKVCAIAAELGYKPNSMARALRGSSSSLIGVIAQNITSIFHSQILRGLNDVAVKRAYRVFLGHVAQKVDIALDYGSMFEHSHADGILIIGELEGNDETLAQRHRYVVGVSDRVTRRSFPGVYSDSIVGTHLALNHLWDLGHRNIICVCDQRLQDGRLRAETYELFMQQQGLAKQAQVISTSRSLHASYQTGQKIFSNAQYRKTTAIFATTDAIAIGLLKAAYHAGISVPRQLSIIGYDDIDIAAFTIPPLTTISQSGFEMGQVAASLLLDMIVKQHDKSQEPDSILLPSLVVRESTAKIKQK